MLISAKYAKQQRKLHRNERYGRASGKWAGMVVELIEKHNPASILDYGAGKGFLGQCIAEFLEGRKFAEYDPGITAIEKMPDGTYAMVCCIDVLEHIEPECLDDVLDSIKTTMEGIAFLTIHTGPAGKELPDGRNAHLIQQPIEWWLQKLTGRFTVLDSGAVNETYWIVCEVNRAI